MPADADSELLPAPLPLVAKAARKVWRQVVARRHRWGKGRSHLRGAPGQGSSSGQGAPVKGWK